MVHVNELPDKVVVTIICPQCLHTEVVELTPKAYEAWLFGRYIAGRCLTSLTKELQGAILDGLCEDCKAKLNLHISLEEVFCHDT